MVVFLCRIFLLSILMMSLFQNIILWIKALFFFPITLDRCFTRDGHSSQIRHVEAVYFSMLNLVCGIETCITQPGSHSDSRLSVKR